MVLYRLRNDFFDPWRRLSVRNRNTYGKTIFGHAIFRKEAEAIQVAPFGNRLALRFVSDRFIAILGYLGAKPSCGQFTEAGALDLDRSN